MRLPKVLLLFLLTAAVSSAPAEARLRAPSLVSPSNETQLEAAPAFTWGAVKGTVLYEFQLSADRGFGSIVLGRGKGKGAFRTKNTAGTINATLPNGTYYWRVRALDAKDRASAWSNIRTFDKSWSTAPNLIGPIDALSVTWPAVPLVLEWSVVPYAVNYIVTVATDPALSSQVLGSTASPLKTRGNVFALPASLAPGQYYWAITPLDADGHPGKRSRIGTFTWSWPSQTTARFTDLNGDPRVVDPEFSWDAVLGAARYEVEVNPDADFAVGSKVCCTDPTTGTSLSPTLILKDNAYHWRVRAVDVDGNAGVWNNGPDFVKNFDVEAGQPSIRNLRIRDNLSDPVVGATNKPIVAWDPVPGASGYEVQGFADCDHGAKVWDEYTATAAWTPIAPPQFPAYPNIGPASWGSPVTDSFNSIFPTVGTQSYCVSVRAFSDRLGGTSASSLNGFISQETEIPLTTAPLPAFAATTPAAATGLDYYGPVSVNSPRMPLFTWNAIPNTKAYLVVIARDPDFIQVVDHVVTRVPAYAPRDSNSPKTYADETTNYYWAVVPYNPDSTPTVPSGSPVPPGARAAFTKQSVPPTLLAPVGEADVTSQPRFNWTPAEAARDYTLQVSQDPSFGEPIDNIVTSSTSYTSSSTYPADTALYWRVRANDENGIGLTWSAVGTFRRRLPVPIPAAGNPTGGERIPVLAWSPVVGAVSYDIHVDKTSGDTQDINTRSTSFTPVLFYGNGIWRWRVRANFPTTSFAKVSGGYFEPQSYVRKIGPTPNVHGTKTRNRYLVSWDPDPAATNYRVEIAPSDGFTRTLETAKTKSTDFAPDLNSRVYDAGGTIYWRVASAEEGNNVGAYTTGTFVLPKGITVKVEGGLRRGKRSTVTVKLTDSKGNRIRSALVRVSGAGVHKSRKRTGRRGTARFSLKPRRRGTVTFTVTRSGYRDATKSVRVR